MTKATIIVCMPTPASRKPLLVPVKAPWSVSTTWGACLIAESSEAAPDDAVVVEFVGAFARHEPKSKTRGQPSAPHHLVEAVFQRGHAARLTPSASETETIRKDDYDWSAVPTEMSSGETLARNLARIRKQWRDTGICPNPRMYEVQRSAWLETLGLAAQPEWKHYLLLGDDGYVEVAAHGWDWKLGRPYTG